MHTPLRDTDGDEVETVELPAAFETPHRPDLIVRAVRASWANRAQDYGTDEFAGLRTPAESFGSGRGLAHVPRQDGQARRVPQTVGGRRAHPPKTAADRTESINDKERRLATESAIAATGDGTLVADRGHAFAEGTAFPIVVEDAFADLEKTQEALGVLEALGLAADVERAEEGRSVRAGRGTTRGRRYKTPASVLVVTASERGPSRAARNLAGVDVATGTNVNASDLAPGGHAGRLTVWTEAALAEVAAR